MKILARARPTRRVTSNPLKPQTAAKTTATPGFPSFTDLGDPGRGRVLSAFISTIDLTGRTIGRRKRDKQQSIRRSASAFKMYGHIKASLVDLLLSSDEPRGDRITTSGYRLKKFICKWRNPFILCYPREKLNGPSMPIKEMVLQHNIIILTAYETHIMFLFRFF